MYVFFFNDTATTEIYTLSLHDALPIYEQQRERERDERRRQVERDHDAAEARRDGGDLGRRRRGLQIGRHPGGEVDTEGAAQERAGVVGPALRDVDGADRVLDDEIPSDDPRRELAEQIGR